MPSTIPYDPSLVLMSVVNDKALKNVEAIAQAQAPVDAAKDALNSLISSKRGLTMTKTELRNLGVETTALDGELENLNKAIEQSAMQYSAVKLTSEAQILKLRSEIRGVHGSIESPVDYLRSQIKTMPLAADTLNMDVQYFSFDSNSQSSSAYSSQIASYVSGAVGAVLGPKMSMQIGTAASRQVSRQVKSHTIEGTLVISVSCTHKHASIVAPFVLHIDKAIKVWNSIFPGSKLDPTDQKSMMKVCMNESQEDKEKFSIISGTTFGSSFVGMVHVLNTSTTSNSQSMTAAAQSMQAKMDVGSWFANKSGKAGVDGKFASDVKNLLSQQNISSHVTLLTTGVIPSMVASEVQLAVDKFASFNPKEEMEQLAVLQEATSADQATVKSQAEASRTSGQAAEVQSNKIRASLSALQEIEDTKNKILDVNSMMTALDDYLQKAQKGEAGVPINYYLKDIDKKMLAQMWVAKYFPGEFMSIKYDDAEGSAAGGAAGGAGEAEASGQKESKL